MQTIIDFFTGISEAVTSFVEWFAGMLSDLAYIARLLGDFVLQIPSYFAWLPAEALISLGVILGIVVIYKLTGREG